MKSIELLRHALEWEYNNNHLEIRLVAKPYPEDNSYGGFEGYDFRTEKLDGIDAMGVERWVETGATEGSLVIATIGQYLLNNSVKE
jgi:hypothetical protein